MRIRKRIEKAYLENQKFRVFIFLPLLPAFPGEVNNTITLQILLKYTYKTISRNRGLSLIEKLSEIMPGKVDDYISFFSLRTHNIINNIPKTEMIYIHSKILIVDDQIALIGSANINDRSMLGCRDSELAVIIKDDNTFLSRMNNQKFSSNYFAHSLRVRLFKEHLGFDIYETQIPEILMDPLNDDLWLKMKHMAKYNSDLYREIFNCYPDNKFSNFTDVLNENLDLDISNLVKRYENKNGLIFGNIVEFPLNFLNKEFCFKDLY